MEIVRCLPSSTEIRLREKAASLAKRFDSDAQVRVTADERHAVEPRPTALDRIPLGAIVLPRPDREHSEVTARQLNPGEAAFWLSRCQRIEGWQDRASLRTQFDDAARVVQALGATVRRGPPTEDPRELRHRARTSAASLTSDPTWEWATRPKLEGMAV
jgi:hypothetical protein